MDKRIELNQNEVITFLGKLPQEFTRADMLTFIRDTKKDVLASLKEKKVIDEGIESALTDAVTAFKQGWQA